MVMKVEDLDVFQLSHRLVLEIYRATEQYPGSEKFCLTSQMRRTSSSICMNLMEGSSRMGKKEYRHFVSIARGSCGEVKYQIKLSKDLGYLEMNTFSELTEGCERISMMLMKLYKSLI
jgi:four helix bundle protein